MTEHQSLPLLVVADDLSGAAETAAALAEGGLRCRVELGGPEHLWSHLPSADGDDVVVVDLGVRDSRDKDIPAADLESIREHGYSRVLVKVDSQLRGPIDRFVAAVAAAGVPVVVATAVPEAGRTVVDDEVLVDGRPLAESPTWAARHEDAPRTVAQAIGSVPTRHVPLESLRAGLLPGIIAGHPSERRVLLCDAVDEGDLLAIADAALAIPTILVGSGGLAAALGRALSVSCDSDKEPAAGVGHPLVVVGTAEPVVDAQIASVAEHGATHIALDAADLIAGTAAADLPAITEALRTAPVILSIAPPLAAESPQSPRLSRSLAEICARIDAAVGPLDVVVTGGETARAVFAALGVDRAVPLGQAHHGAVVFRAGERILATRPGSFGGDGSLVAMVDEVRRQRARAGHVSPRPAPDTIASAKGGIMTTAPTDPSASRSPSGGLPAIAVTMGDGAGVGPEITVAAAVHPDIVGRCRPVVIGDAHRLREAARILDMDVDIVSVSGVAEAVAAPRRINVIDLDLLPHDLTWGEPSAVAGDAAFQYVRVACELAQAGEVQAICTAPLNKAALHSGGHPYPGHTEMLADLTGTEEVSMMLSTPTVKVIHVTTHMGLVDAIAAIEPGLVERTIRRGHGAMVQAGIARPRIGVCAINPHAGENGLFGHGEEALKIEPAIRAAREDGIDAQGPLPADTAFFLASRGDYDLIVAMYHDQGHGPVKVLGIETGVNITVGLPVIRTSVDHGTAFDIAGTGTVDTRSMVEALRQAAALAPASTGSPPEHL